MMSDAAVDYYRRKFGDDLEAAFIHVVREVGELARAVEREQKELAAHEITELAALMRFLASHYGFDLEGSVADLYNKKLQKMEGA